MSEESPVFMNPGDDTEMEAASQRARVAFRFFWREMTWEYRRIIPGLGVAAVKVAFSDPPLGADDPPPEEHMWLGEVMFDGATVSGTLMNAPNWVRSVRAGDRLHVPLAEIGDWMYSQSDRCYGAFTVNLMRSRMSAPERANHDEAWGLDFGDPFAVQLIPSPAPAPAPKKGLFSRKKVEVPIEAPDLAAEHPMALNMAQKMDHDLRYDSGPMRYRDERGFGPLHDMALGGSAACAQVLLNHGADPTALTGHGWSAAQLAHALDWHDVVALLQHHGG